MSLTRALLAAKSDKNKDKMAIFGGKQLNLIIGIDTTYYCLTVMRIVGNDISTCQVNYISVEPALVNEGKWAEIIADYLPDYIESQHFDKTFAVHLVLPDRLVATDIFTVPTLSTQKTIDALNMQVNELYSFAPDYKFNRLLLTSNKSNSTYELFMTNKDKLNRIYKAFSALKLYVKECTYAASSALNAVFALRPKTRKQSFLFLDIKSKSARISVCGNGNTIGWVELPFGLDYLSDKTVNVEANVVRNDIPYLAIVNATKIAKKGKISIVQDEMVEAGILPDPSAVAAADTAADGAPQNETQSVDENNAAAGGADDGGSADENNAETAGEGVVLDADAARPAETPEEASRLKSEISALVESSTAVTEAAQAAQLEKIKPAIPTTRKFKKLPALLKRPQPHAPAGYVYENFRAFMKRCLLVKMQNEQSEYLPVPSFVLVNMPEEYAYLIDEANKEKDNGIEFRFFEPAKENNIQLTSNLELFGVLYTKSYNKPSTF